MFEYSLIGSFVGGDKLPECRFELSLLLGAPGVTKRSWALVRMLGFGVWVHGEDSLLSDWLCRHTTISESLVRQLSNDRSVLAVA